MERQTRRKAASELLTLMDPRFNLREITKQMILLEDHLQHANKVCPDCIRKHLLSIEALAEEATTLNSKGLVQPVSLTEDIAMLTRLWLANFTDGRPLDELANDIRRLRKRLVSKYFDPRSGSVQKVATRWLQAELDPKMEILLRKIRKKAATSLTLKNLLAVLDLIGGWTVKPFLGLTNMGSSGEDGISTFSVRGGDRTEYNEIKSQEIPTLPASPKVGETYYLEVSGLKPSYEGRFYFDALRYRGVEALRFTDPKGNTWVLKPNWIDAEKHIDTYKKIHIYDFWDWAFEESTLLEQVNTLLGLGEVVKKPNLVRDNTGSCSACFRNIKLKNGIVVLHGYERPGWGSVEGKCFGCYYPPFELSPKGTEALIVELTKTNERNKEDLRQLKDGEITEIPAGPHTRRIFTPKDYNWKDILASAVRNAQQKVNDLDADIRMAQNLVKNWKLRPLPLPGMETLIWT